MEKSASKRALRRHHTQRLKRYYKQQAHDWTKTKEKRDPVAAGKHFQTPHPCSCFMCGHRRRWYSLSLAEQKNQLNFAEQIADI
jgi:hypothetical protein